MSAETPLFIMRDTRSDLGYNAMFWSQGSGYNSHIDKARRFTLEEAQAIHDSRRTDIPILLSCAEAISYPAIDVQHISKAESVSYAGDEYIIQRANMYNGNYIHYISEDAANDGQLYTDNYSKAQAYTLHQALSIAADGSGLVMWPKLYFDDRVTKCAPISLIDNQAMGFDHGIKENKLEKVPA
ncbi:hypothetical protein MHM93_14315 [Pseudoalteromonas sp. MM17-2]|uniref:hypothetical protein n=1 Tax=Pseudoalteromonas sp. MM17-2 TaxID=2917753 RepID=UPI001EF734E5|nr:hypothetical protein [Pseudoalteromonas sp. MM17-2]MCG7545351.1 hypothetical protein [Pseudoalteromonas sp. MM17-2]